MIFIFTGIIEEVGQIKAVNRLTRGYDFEIRGNKVLEKTKIGDSIAVDGVCLTVTKIVKDTFSVNVMNETLFTTILKDIKIGALVNLERALTLNKPLGGHLVTGHIDTIGTIKNIGNDGYSKKIEISYNKCFSKYLIHKGSIALNGISLTISNLRKGFFEVSVIPHSQNNTNIRMFKEGEKINLEFDIVGKYISRFLDQSKEVNKESNINIDFLSKHNFI